MLETFAVRVRTVPAVKEVEEVVRMVVVLSALTVRRIGVEVLGWKMAGAIPYAPIGTAYP